MARHEDRLDPLASPLRAADLAGLPPATILLCHKDPLRSEGEAYAARLAEADVPVTLTVYHDLIHASFRMAGVTPRARAFVHSAGSAVREAYAAGASLDSRARTGRARRPTRPLEATLHSYLVYRNFLIAGELTLAFVMMAAPVP